ncbi:MAG: class I SAM-dependent methyltransferase [Clostridiales bacterium]|nr:class I SAM-dependent methyltransferase [Clostridiales bacterium]
MDEQTIFERLECQNKIWKIGLYNYLYNQIYSVRFAMAHYYVKSFFENAKILDVGAGSGILLTYLNDIANKYYYNDISEQALNIFKSSDIYINNKSKIELLFGNINNIELDVIISLGIAKHLYNQNTFLVLFEQNLREGGIMLLETTETCDALTYYCELLPKPFHSIKYEIIDDVESNSANTRIMNIYKK